MPKIEALKFTREDKSEVTIVVNTYDAHTGLEFRLDEVYIREYRKQKRTSVKTRYRDDYIYRGLSMDERKRYLLKKLLEVVTFEQVQEAITNAWQICKPKIDTQDDINVTLCL